MIWKQGFTDYAIDIARIYKVSPEKITCCLGFGAVADCLSETYLILVKERQLNPIEMLPHQTKIDLWQEAKKYSVEKKKCVLISRSLYLLNELTK